MDDDSFHLKLLHKTWNALVLLVFFICHLHITSLYICIGWGFSSAWIRLSKIYLARILFLANLCRIDVCDLIALRTCVLPILCSFFIENIREVIGLHVWSQLIMFCLSNYFDCSFCVLKTPAMFILGVQFIIASVANSLCALIPPVYSVATWKVSLLCCWVFPWVLNHHIDYQ